MVVSYWVEVEPEEDFFYIDFQNTDKSTMKKQKENMFLRVQTFKATC